jgi:predicted PilT family ATPase
MVELVAQFLLVDLVGELHRGRAVDQREGRVDLGVQPQIICSISSL